MSTRYFRREAGLGPLYPGDRHGQLVADVLVELVEQRWADGSIVSESSEVKSSGKRAIALDSLEIGDSK